MRFTTALLTGIAFANSAWAGDAAGPTVKDAIAKALKRVETGVSNYPRHRQCFSCHHQAMAVFSLTAARQRGFAVDDAFVKQQVEFSLKTFRNKSLIAKGQGVGGDTTSVVYALQTFAAAAHPYDDRMAALVEYLLVKQQRDGSWPVPSFGDRPPTMGSRFTNAGLALFVLKHYSPPRDAEDAAALQERIDDAIARGLNWLLANQPISTEDKVFRLRGLVDGGAEAKVIAEARDHLLKDQLPDGSWAQLANMTGDAYATATVLVALRRAGLDPNQEAYRKGSRYLLDTQKDDGAWIVQTRSRPLQKFFDNGDPGGKSQFISFAATNWAVLALLETIPAETGQGKQPGK